MGQILIVIFIPPLRFAVQKRWGAVVIDTIFYGMAWLFLLSFVGAVFAPAFWFIAMVYAAYDLATSTRRRTMEEHAALVGLAVAASVTAAGGGGSAASRN